MKTRILIIDDHFAQRLGLTVAISHEGDLEVVGQGGSVAEAISLYAALKPDVVLLDFSLPDGTGVDALRQIMRADEQARVIMLTVLDGEENVFQSKEAGASGYLTKANDSITLLAAIRAVAAGQSYFPSAMVAKVEARLKREPLTGRELEILRLIVEGLSNKEIGSRLAITEGTVKLHVSKILTKIGAMDRTRAALLAVERGMVRL